MGGIFAMKRKLISLVLATCMMVGLAACGGPPPDGSSQESGGTKTETEIKEAFNKLNLK